MILAVSMVAIQPIQAGWFGDARSRWNSFWTAERKAMVPDVACGTFLIGLVLSAAGIKVPCSFGLSFLWSAGMAHAHLVEREQKAAQARREEDEANRQREAEIRRVALQLLAERGMLSQQ